MDVFKQETTKTRIDLMINGVGPRLSQKERSRINCRKYYIKKKLEEQMFKERMTQSKS